MERRSFIAAVGAAAARKATVRSFELEEISLSEIADGLASGRWTSRKLVDLYVSRIQAMDRNGPALRSVIEINPKAAALAEQLDRERKSRRQRGALHGVPILVKDNIETGDGMVTSAGSLALENARASADAFIVSRLRAAGALILGKTNLSEWANFRSTRSVSGWSGRGGQTRCPYDLRRNPSGSSSGSAVAVSASLCAGAIGTETDGSVVSPASVNGIVGLKPTLGLVSRSGIVPIAHSQDTAGPMARTVRDVALLLNAMAGPDEQDPATHASRGHIGNEYSKSLDAAGLRGARLGIARKFFEKNAPLDRFLNSCADVLRRSGAEIIDGADLPSHGKGGDAEFEVLLFEFKSDLNAYLARLPERRTLADLIDFNRKNRDREMPLFDQEIFELAEAKGPLTDPKYIEARRTCLKLTREEGIDAVLEQNKLDAIVTLTSGPACLIDDVNGDQDTGGCSAPPAIAGYPHITVPAGLFRGLPVGLSFFGRPWSEPLLLKFAFAYESATHGRQRPRYLSF